MGFLKRMLSFRKVNLPSMYEEFVRVESCEAFHLHFRDLRLILTKGQIETIQNSCNDGMTVNSQPTNGDVLLDSKILPDEQIFKEEIKIELVEGGTVHFHYKDIRIEMLPNMFAILAEMFDEAAKVLNEEVFFIPLELIDPYDHCHFADKEKWFNDDYQKHEEGINYVMQELAKGKKPRPIIVTVKEDGTYWRRDGYKRYMAFKRLGIPKIPCYIVTESKACEMPQDGKKSFDWGEGE
jgi:hypothetical protein